MVHGLAEVVTDNVHFCCLERSEIIPKCRKMKPSALWSICSDRYPKGSPIIYFGILAKSFINVTALLYLFLSSRKQQTSFSVTIFVAFAMSVLLIIFHSHNQTASMSQNIKLDNEYSVTCAAIAYGHFGLNYTFLCCNIVFFSKIEYENKS